MKRLLMLSIAAAAVVAWSARAGDAKALYDHHCAMCHGADGKGATRIGKRLGVKDYTDPQVQAKLTDEAAFKAIKEGLKDKDGKVLMRPLKDASETDIKGLVSVMRSFKKK